jgi:acyl-CoA reductase-like NAD-dependent aldehyde dehydrogenase
MNRAEAEKAVERIIENLIWRQGLGNGWASTPPEARAEIREAWIQILIEETQPFSEKLRAAEEARKKAEEELAQLRPALTER